MRSRNWCFTLNNPTDDDPAYLCKFLAGYEGLYDWDTPYEHELPGIANFLCMGREVGAEGTPHLQGYVQFKNGFAKGLGWLHNHLPRCHWEPMRGTPEEATDYCMKDAHFIILGDFRMSAADCERNRWAKAYELAREGAFDEIDRQIYISHRSNLKGIYADCTVRPPDLPGRCGILYWGVPHSGKSHNARAFATEQGLSFYVKDHTKWWDGYADEEIVIIDDVGRAEAKENLTHYKNWLDRYPFKAEIKGSYLHIRPKAVILTSNYSVEQLWPKSIDAEAMRSRLVEQVHFEQRFEHEVVDVPLS